MNVSAVPLTVWLGVEWRGIAEEDFVGWGVDRDGEGLRIIILA